MLVVGGGDGVLSSLWGEGGVGVVVVGVMLLVGGGFVVDLQGAGGWFMRGVCGGGSRWRGALVVRLAWSLGWCRLGVVG